MRESIICVGQMAGEPYRFPETGTPVYSYEELCYYLSRHMIFYLYSLPEKELLLYIREELGMEKLYRQLSRYTDPGRDQMKYFAALFREGNYFSEEEIRRILDEYRDLKNTSYALQCKWTGDELLKAGRASAAIYHYQEALRTEEMNRSETGAVYHNMALAKSRLFRFEDAGIDFVKAYQYAGDEESLFGYFGIVAFTEDLGRAREEMETFQISELSMEAFENRFADIADDFACSGQAEMHRKIEYLQQSGREEEAKNRYAHLVRRLQTDFRSEMEQPDEKKDTQRMELVV